MCDQNRMQIIRIDLSRNNVGPRLYINNVQRQDLYNTCERRSDGTLIVSKYTTLVTIGAHHEYGKWRTEYTKAFENWGYALKSIKQLLNMFVL